LREDLIGEIEEIAGSTFDRVFVRPMTLYEIQWVDFTFAREQEEEQE